MADSIIFQSPIVLALLIFALVFMLIALFFRSVAKPGLIIAMVMFTAAITYVLIMGADLIECAVVSAVFFILSLIVIIKDGR